MTHPISVNVTFIVLMLLLTIAVVCVINMLMIPERVAFWLRIFIVLLFILYFLSHTGLYL